MNHYLQTSEFLAGRITNRELVTGLRSVLDRKYSRIVRAAGDEWQRRFAGKDPSDACVSVRISPARGRAAGVLENGTRAPERLQQFTSRCA